MKYTLRVQSRDKTAADPGLIDTFGVSTVYQGLDGIDVGIAYNRVRDGVVDPGPGQPREGDTALIVGARYEEGPWYSAATLSFTRNHEQDDLGRYYDGTGLEVFAEYDRFERFDLFADLGYLTPGSSPPGDYERMTLALGINCSFYEDRAFVYLLGQLDLGTRSDGSAGDDNRGAVILRFNV